MQHHTWLVSCFMHVASEVILELPCGQQQTIVKACQFKGQKTECREKSRACWNCPRLGGKRNDNTKRRGKNGKESLIMRQWSIRRSRVKTIIFARK